MFYVLEAQVCFDANEMGEHQQLFVEVYTTYERMRNYLAQPERLSTVFVRGYDGEPCIATERITYTYRCTTDVVPDDLDKFEYDDNICGCDVLYTHDYHDVEHTCARPPRGR